MEPLQSQIARAEELARRFPVSAELMYYYRDLARFHELDLSPLHGLPGDLGAFYRRLSLPAPPQTPACSHAPSFRHADPEFPHITLELCDLCHSYRKHYDLVLDPAAVPEIDDLASVPLDLWAVAHGYRNLAAPNLWGF